MIFATNFVIYDTPIATSDRFSWCLVDVDVYGRVLVTVDVTVRYVFTVEGDLCAVTHR